mgnify:CR=1 FL=1
MKKFFIGDKVSNKLSEKFLWECGNPFFSKKDFLILFFLLLSVACKEKSQPNLSPIKVAQPANSSSASPTSNPSELPEGFPNPPGNLLANPGFENGRDGWKWMDWSQHWVDFDIREGKAHSGKKSAYLKLDYGDDAPKVRIHGLVQELKPSRFPDVIRGWYRVENWKRGSNLQYLQFVTIVWGGHPQFKNYQIRYILAGINSPPYDMRNVKYIILPDATLNPTQNKWIEFKASMIKDFEKLWGIIPRGYDKIVFLFEARYDAGVTKGMRVRADVYFDDIYVGSE